MDKPVIIYTNASLEKKQKFLRMRIFRGINVEFRPLPALWFWMDAEGHLCHEPRR